MDYPNITSPKQAITSLNGTEYASTSLTSFNTTLISSDCSLVSLFILQIHSHLSQFKYFLLSTCQSVLISLLLLRNPYKVLVTWSWIQNDLSQCGEPVCAELCPAPILPLVVNANFCQFCKSVSFFSFIFYMCVISPLNTLAYWTSQNHSSRFTLRMASSLKHEAIITELVSDNIPCRRIR